MMLSESVVEHFYIGVHLPPEFGLVRENPVSSDTGLEANPDNPIFRQFMKRLG